MGKIGWTDATWNPTTGCSHVSAGCEHCYAETLSLRHGWSKKPWTARNAAENVRLHPERLDQPLRWRRSRRVFVNSMSDLFHPLIPDEFIDEVFAVMAVTPEHTYQVLTKRPERMRGYMARAFASEPTVRCIRLELEGDRVLSSHSDGYPWPLPNVWLGVSVEDQETADERIPPLLETPAAVRFLSCEPILGPITFPLPSRGSVFWGGLHWVIAGGESGPGYRPMDPTWARSLRDQCAAAGVPFFAKQGSGPRPGKQYDLPDEVWQVKEFPDARFRESAGTITENRRRTG